MPFIIPPHRSFSERPKANASGPLEIAIVGGGIGGLCMAIGLLDQKHLKFKIYERASSFREIGAGVGLGPNAQEALKVLDHRILDGFMKHAIGNMSDTEKDISFRLLRGKGPGADETLALWHGSVVIQHAHRAKFVDEMAALVPPDVCEFSKQVTEIEDKTQTPLGKMVLHFADGSTATADAVIGSDGVHSVTRKFLLGEDHPAQAPRFSGCCAYRGLIPMDVAVEHLGQEIANNSHLWCGEGGYCMSYPIELGKTLNVVMTNMTFKKWEGAWVQGVKKGELSEMFSEWCDNVKKIASLLDTDKTVAWSLWHHSINAPSFQKKRCIIVGDAAHAMTPFQGSGASQAIEDAATLHKLLEKVTSIEELELAFQAYDMTRRPRAQAIVKTSREAGRVYSFTHPYIKDDPEKFRHNTENRMNWIWEFDVGQQAANAVNLYNNLKMADMDEDYV